MHDSLAFKTEPFTGGRGPSLPSLNCSDSMSESECQRLCFLVWTALAPLMPIRHVIAKGAFSHSARTARAQRQLLR